MSRKNAFTLIELLVVIAIIAILASILFPVFSQAKLAAKKTTSMSNMKQLGTGMALYLGDSHDVTPSLYYYDSTDLTLPTTQGFYYLVIKLQPYMKSTAVVLDPLDTSEDPVVQDQNGRGRFDPKNELRDYIIGAFPSYGFNYRYLNDRIDARDPNGNNPTPFYYVGKDVSALGSSSSTVMFAEATAKDKARPNGGGTIQVPIGYSRIEPPSYWTNDPWPNAKGQGQLWPRYSKDKVIVTWLDSHVKVTPIKSLKGKPDSVDTLDVFWNGLAQ